ncbi:MAG TPA: penicillin-binding transpeptidase domain-containing protein [Actinomycetes bacterium]|nr:penicillin-binding transpeptidase domain-containing protein [Actinomycetes bacterium]
MSKGSKVVGLVVAVALVLGAAGAGAWWFVLRPRGSPEPVAAAYLDAWQRADWAAMQRLVAAPPADFAAQHAAMLDNLKVRGRTFALGPVRRDGDRAEAPFTARLDLRGLGEWSYQGALRLARRDRRTWLVDWSPATIHPSLVAGKRFARSRTQAERAPILARDGSLLAGPGSVVVVGVVGQGVKDRGQAQRALTGPAGAAPAAVARALGQAAATPAQFVPVVTLSEARYQAVRPEVFPVPGIRFRRETGRLASAPASAALAVGRVSPATADDLKRLGPPYQTGDLVGHGGLEGAFERQLAGTPTGEVLLADAQQGADGAAAPRTVLQRFPGRPGTPLRTTLDPRVQAAADKALAGVAKPAALVAVQASTGELRAVANWPPGGGFDRALLGRYPPGSTFKVVTTEALLEAGVKPADRVTCPPTVAVGGRSFRNFEGEQLGAIPFSAAFAHSCNTAFVQLAAGRLDAAKLAAAGERFGFGSDLSPGIPAVKGSFPAPGDRTELAAAAIGQGRVVASPLQMATVAATVQSGAWRAPRLVTSGPPPAPPRPLDPQVAGALRGLMRAVVTEGTAAPARLPAGAGGKTGTAEFGRGDPLPTHAWFIGFRGDLAFAVVVEGGGVGGRVAAPVGARFLGALR